MKTLTVISPVLNEEAVIAGFFADLSAVLKSLEDRYQWRILFVVDRCGDRTLEILKGLAAEEKRIQILALSSRFGHQMSLLAGIDHCHSDVAVMMDCDLQHPPELIPEMLRHYEDGYDVVYTVKADYSATASARRVTSRIYYWVLQRLSSSAIYANASDFTLISCRVVELFQEKIRERTLFLRGLIAWVGFPHTAVSFKVNPRLGGESKYNMSSMLRLALHGMLSFSKKPLRLASMIGLTFAGLGFLYGAYVLVNYFMTDDLPPGWTALAMLVAVFSGIQLIFLGVIGEYIGAIFDEVKARPHYIIEETMNFE
ncbi:MAG: glycosyltransferase family 2 protein [Chloroflexi bacterium]|nr:glycosyltransferase family 2 protein [Chloroflexota bacterium]